MTERERLAGLIAESIRFTRNPSAIAGVLLKHGVIVPPCKVGDVVYRICVIENRPFVSDRIVLYITVYENRFVIGTLFAEDILGKTVFLTREEAEAALAERRKA